MNWSEQMDLRSPFASVMLLEFQLPSELLAIANNSRLILSLQTLLARCVVLPSVFHTSILL